MINCLISLVTSESIVQILILIDVTVIYFQENRHPQPTSSTNRKNPQAKRRKNRAKTRVGAINQITPPNKKIRKARKKAIHAKAATHQRTNIYQNSTTFTQREQNNTKSMRNTNETTSEVQIKLYSIEQLI